MFYKIVRGFLVFVAHVLYRIQITGRENIPKEGAFLLCGNHIHAFDGAVLAVASKRPLRFLSKQEIFKNRLFGWVLKKMGAFPINRGTADMQAYRHTINSLKEGHGLLIFSQGTRMKDFENAKSGVAVFALKTGAPIVPVGIKGTYKFRSKLRIQIGEPISMEEYAGQKIKTEIVDEVMGTLSDKITGLLK